MFAFFFVFWSFAAIFFFCEIGEQVSHQFDEFYREFYQCNWYAFPIQLQQAFLQALPNVQQPTVIHGYAKTFCTREAFKNVRFNQLVFQLIRYIESLFAYFQTVYVGFSYFMMLHQVY